MKRPNLTVDRLAARDGRRCAHCGIEVNLTVQHRANRGMGGRRSAERMSNGIILCWAANTALESHAAAAAYARECGWKVSKHADPSEVPVWDAVDQCWWLLDDEGGKRAA